MTKKQKKPKKIKLKSLGRNLKWYKKILKDTTTNFEWLNKFKLPKLTNPDELASFLNIDIYSLIKYCVAEKKISPHEFFYRRFSIKKKSGGKREILAPKKELKKIQNKIYEDILKKVAPSDFSHGFRENYSIVTNAKIHLNAKVIYNIDLRNFFPSIKFGMVLKVFRDIGYSGLIASLLAALCTIPPRRYLAKKNQWILKRSTYYNPQLHYLPQGAPTSPHLSNLACLFLDNELNHISNEFNFRYSRYADDLTFSSTGEEKISEEFRKKIRYYLRKYKLRVNWKKEKYHRKFKQRRITGIVVHKDYISLPRFWTRRLRAALHELKVKNFEKDDPYFLTLVKNIEGRCAYAMMVNKQKYSHFFEEFKSLKASKFK
jgi:hypothetical protein